MNDRFLVSHRFPSFPGNEQINIKRGGQQSPRVMNVSLFPTLKGKRVLGNVERNLINHRRITAELPQKYRSSFPKNEQQSRLVLIIRSIYNCFNEVKLIFTTLKINSLLYNFLSVKKLVYLQNLFTPDSRYAPDGIRRG